MKIYKILSDVIYKLFWLKYKHTAIYIEKLNNEGGRKQMNNNFKIVNINSITDVFIKNSNIQYTWVQYSLKEQAVLYAEVDNDKTSVLFKLSSIF